MSQPDLLTYKEISERTGISVPALRKRLCMGTMPEPDLRHGATPVWYAATLKNFLASAEHGVHATSRTSRRKP